MKIEEQVCSLELAKKLKEFGVKQKSLVYWLNIKDYIHMKVKEDGHTVETDENGQPIIDKIDYRIELGNPSVYNIDKDDFWSAFTVAELGEMLPKYVIENEVECYFRQIPSTHLDKWTCFYSNGFRYSTIEEQEDENEANVRAKMLIYLLENKLMELPNDKELKK